MQSQAVNLMRRRGRKQALVVLAHSLRTVIYPMLKEDTAYGDLGPQFPDRIRAQHLVRFPVKRLRQLGLNLAIEPIVA